MKVIKVTKISIAAILILYLSSCDKRNKVFTQMDASFTGINFENTIIEDSLYNVYDYPHIYYGAGVAVGDINNDGLVDVYFGGNLVSGALYLNQGNFKFKDITKTSGLDFAGWETGINFIDINQDGWLDLYINISGKGTPEERKNKLFINNGDLTFTESALKYGLDEKKQTIQSAFFDYDKDGDIDVFMIVNPSDFDPKAVSSIRKKKIKGEGKSTDLLFKNNGDGTFTDVSSKAGILIEGYSLGVAVSDINKDGWADIYISNDFVSNDILYINQKDGTFKNQAKDYLAHTSFAGMGNDIADINNDGLSDIIELDMLPEDNYRTKIMLGATNPKKFELMLQNGYEPQYTRNTLQLNTGNNRFSEIGFFSGVSATEWSWAPLLADFDNDGDRDLFVTNGYARDMGNLDFINYSLKSISSFGSIETRKQKYLKAVSELKPVSLPNYVFENKNGLQFKNSSKDWGININSISSGAAYADFDNDGDLDFIINNINATAFLYKNNTNNSSTGDFLKVILKGPKGNIQGIGTKISLKSTEGPQYYEHYLTKGYLSSMSTDVHFGLGKEGINELRVEWPDGATQVIGEMAPNQQIIIDYKDATETTLIDATIKETLFKPVLVDSMGYEHLENEYSDFDVQPLLPHMHSRNGPGIGVADIDGNGFDDYYIGGASGSVGSFFLQDSASNFKEQKSSFHSISEDMGILFFDADSDGDQDLYVTSGGSSTLLRDKDFQDRLYENNGKGEFLDVTNLLPKAYFSSSCVVGADYDKDGDIDLFIGGRVVPGEYPVSPKSMLLKNNRIGEEIRFEKVDNVLLNLGMVTDARWTDIDNDGWLDLLVVGEFMPLTILKNNKGVLKKIESPKGLENSNGWWNSITSGDFDEDGDIDYVIGNLGLNSRYKANSTEPLELYNKDFDQNGTMDPLISRYIMSKKQLSASRDDLIKQISAMRNRFKNYEDYALADFQSSLLMQELNGAEVYSVNTFSHYYVENLGGMSFKMIPLPLETQVSSLYGMLTNDFDGDGHKDILLTGNSFATEVSTGRYDALTGILLKGDGKGDFKPVASKESGFYRPGDAKGITLVSTSKGTQVISASNDDAPKIYSSNFITSSIKIKDDEVYALITKRDGTVYKEEFYYGDAYLSASPRKINLSKNIQRIDIINIFGDVREVIN